MKVSPEPKCAPITPTCMSADQQDVRAPARRDVTFRREALRAGGCLTKAAFEQLRIKLAKQELEKNIVPINCIEL